MSLKTMWQKLDLTADWRIRCPGCGKTRNLTELGGYRYGPRSLGIGKRTLGWCRSCRSLRLLVIEPAPFDAAG